MRAASEAAGGQCNFVYDGGYHEVVAYQALDLIRRDSEQSDIRGASWTACFLGTIRMLPVWRCNELCGGDRIDRPMHSGPPKAGRRMPLYAMLDAMTVVLAEFKRDWDDSGGGGVRLPLPWCVVCAGVVRAASCRCANLARKRPDDAPLAAGQVHLGVGEETPLSGRRHERARGACRAGRRRRSRAIAWVCWADLHHDAFRAAANEGACSGARPRCTGGPCWKSTTIFTALSLPRLPRRSRAPTATCVWRPRRCISIRTPFATACAEAKDVLGMPDSPDREFAFLLGLVYLDYTNPFAAAVRAGRRFATRRSMLLGQSACNNMI